MALSGIIWPPVHSVRTAGTVSDVVSSSLYPVSEFAADDAWRQNVSIVAAARLKDMSFCHLNDNISRKTAFQLIE